ncbi:MAG: arsenate reductase ArsC [Promethearchaeota archaeon]|nr:MAG: arsenate reductase ArsC [Candidatus Lokiarchaeota archaeon]
MAEAFLRRYAGDHFEVYSAGFEPQPIHPFTIKVMEELGYDMCEHSSKGLDQFLGQTHFGIVVTVCAKAEEKCPVFPGLSTRLAWPFEDPSAFRGTDNEKLEQFRKVRDQIQERVLEWLKARNISSS